MRPTDNVVNSFIRSDGGGTTVAILTPPAHGLDVQSQRSDPNSIEFPEVTEMRGTVLKLTLLIVGVLLSLGSACQRTPPVQITQQAKTHKASVLVFLAPDCPLSQSYSATLNNLHSQFEGASFGFYGIVAGNDSSGNELQEFVSRYKLNFPVLLDRDFALANFFDATKTPEAFALNSSGRIFYKGAIDNWASSLGDHRQVITDYYLRDALNSFLEGKDVKIKQTQAVGCFIERS